MSLILLAALALGADAQAPLPAKPDNKKPKLVCVEETPLGSRLGGRRTCRTADEWRAMQREARDGTENAQRLNILHGN